jgi:hypothetical protein
VLGQLEFEAALGRPLASREEFVGAVRRASESGSGFAAGKLGESERAWLQYPIVLARQPDPLRKRAYELTLGHRSLKASGIFPTEPAFYRRWSEAYLEHVRGLDSIGVSPRAFDMELEILRFHGLTAAVCDAKDQQPDRSSPSVEDRCYLPSFRGRHLLIVCPFAELLKERATKATFEAVWEKTGKPWFEPASVDALEFPYGFDPETQDRYGTALDQFEDLKTEIARRDFDVALIAAGGLGDGVAAFVKDLDKVGISLGGHLQVLFGVIGSRWRGKETWRRRYFTDAWIDMPDDYKQSAAQTIENYW